MGQISAKLRGSASIYQSFSEGLQALAVQVDVWMWPFRLGLAALDEYRLAAQCTSELHIGEGVTDHDRPLQVDGGEVTLCCQPMPGLGLRQGLAVSVSGQWYM